MMFILATAIQFKVAVVISVPNYDFSVIRKNNNYSSEDKLLRSDSYYRKPRLAVTNNSVKYDMITNEVLPFKYS